MKKGFTLIELLATIVILSLIMVVAINPVNKILQDRKKDSFFVAAKSIVRDVEYDKWSNTNFETAFLIDLQMSGVSSNNYDLDNSKVYIINDEFYIDLIGKGKFDGLYACGVTKNSKNNLVGTTPCS